MTPHTGPRHSDSSHSIFVGANKNRVANEFHLSLYGLGDEGGDIAGTGKGFHVEWLVYLPPGCLQVDGIQLLGPI